MEKDKNVKGKITWEFEQQKRQKCENQAKNCKNRNDYDKNCEKGASASGEKGSRSDPPGTGTNAKEMPTLRVRPSRVPSVPEGMTSASASAAATNAGEKTADSAKVTSRLAPMGLMNNLPYMGELTFDTRPRRGRKPKKADICHLISKNYGIQFPNSYVNHPNSSLAAAATATTALPKGGTTPKRKSRKLAHSRGGSALALDALDPPPDVNAFPWKFLPELIPSSGISRFHTPQQQQQQNSSQNNNNNKTIPQISISACGDMGLIFPPSITLTPITRNLLDEPLNLCLRDSSGDSTTFPRLGGSGSEVNNNNIRDSNVARPPHTHTHTHTKPIRDSNLVNSASASADESRREQSTTTTKQHTKKRTWEQQPQPQPPIKNPPNCSPAKARERSSSAAAAAAAVAAANSAQVSICKFKFTGGAKPSLQEKKMLSVDSGGNFRFFTDKPANNSNSGGSGSGNGGSNPSGRNPRDDLSLQFSSDSTTLPKSAKSMSMCMMPSIMAASASAQAHAHASASASASPPMTAADSHSSHDEDQPMEFKEENPSLSPQSCNESSESSANDHPATLSPRGTRAGCPGGTKLKVKRKRRTRKSLVREKLEKTFKEKGFLIQTQQLESAEGATYCKFRQLRKFTRYLFRSWKDYLPDTVKEIGGSGSPPGVGASAAPAPTEAPGAAATAVLPPGESSDQSQSQSDRGNSRSPTDTAVKSEREKDVR